MKDGFEVGLVHFSGTQAVQTLNQSAAVRNWGHTRWKMFLALCLNACSSVRYMVLVCIFRGHPCWRGLLWARNRGGGIYFEGPS